MGRWHFFPALYGSPRRGAFVEKQLSQCELQWPMNPAVIYLRISGLLSALLRHCRLTTCACVKCVCVAGGESHRHVCIHVEVKSLGQVINNELFCQKSIPCLIRTLRTERPSSVCSGEMCVVCLRVSEERIHVPGLWPLEDRSFWKGFGQGGFHFISHWHFYFGRKKMTKVFSPPKKRTGSPPDSPPSSERNAQ